MARVVDGGMHYACGSCHGRMVGLAPFERAHPSARQVWVASGSGTAAGTCPFCGGSLIAPAMDAPPPGLSTCRRCEQFWVPPEAAAWFDATSAAAPGSGPGSGSGSGSGAGSGPAAAPARPDSCPGCGAPWAPDPGGRCRYCREQLSAEPTTVFISAPARPGAGLLGALLDVADRL